MKKTLSFLLLIILVSLCSAAVAVAADTWQPDHEIRYIVPYAPGGASDAIGRIAAEFLSQELGVPVIIDNIPGAGCVIGWTELATQPADGYTVSMASTVASPWSAIAFSPETPPWKADDFIPVGSMTGLGATGGFVTKKGRWPDFMAFIKEVKEKPGKIKYGVQGPGQPMDTQLWELEKVAGLEFNVVYYSDSSSIQTDLLTGDLDVGYINANRVDFVANENFDILSLWGHEIPAEYPVQGLPHLIDFADELGFKWEDTTYLPLNFVRQDLIARADTAPAILARLGQAVENMSKNPEYKEKILSVGWPYYINSEEALADYRHLGQVWDAALKSPEYQAFLDRITR